MKRQRLVMLLAMLALFIATVGAQTDGSPTGTEKASIKLIQADKTEATVEGRMVNFKLTGKIRPKGQMSFPTVDSPVVSNVSSILVPFSMNDVPGGTVYVVRLKPDKKTGFAWGTDPWAHNVPQKDYVVIETGKLKTLEMSRVEGGTLLTFNAGKELKPGPHAVMIADNKCAWAFLIR